MKTSSIRSGVIIAAMAVHFTVLDPCMAQSPGIDIEAASSAATDPSLVSQATELRKAGKLLDRTQWEAMLKTPIPAALQLPAALTQILPAREIAQRARKASVHVGWFYLCERCDHWHLNFSGGYAVAVDGAVVTCDHCVEPYPAMREGYLVALDSERHILPVTAVLARNQVMDTAIIRVASANLTPLALNDQVAPGDPAFLLSDPLNVSGYFSSGIVNRFFWVKGKENDATTLQGVRQLRLNVSTDWAPGSSGAAVLDQCGNAIGHVDSIMPLSEGGAGQRVSKPAKPDGPAKAPDQDRFHGASLITLHLAIPARSVLLLAKSMDGSSPAAKAPSQPQAGSAQ